jgi:ribonucleotide monophosphatase NagD (HAD superfamily)
MKSYQEIVFDEEKNTLAIDFDGVIHNDNLGFYDGTIYGDLIEGAKESLQKIKEMGYRIVIFTAKAKKDRPLINNKTGIQLVWEWLERHDLAAYVSDVTAEKPRAKVYIDDKGYRHSNWNDTMDFICKL